MWGSDSIQPIHMGNNDELLVTANLHAALRRLTSQNLSHIPNTATVEPTTAHSLGRYSGRSHSRFRPL